jgi:hypothetical protein
VAFAPGGGHIGHFHGREIEGLAGFVLHDEHDGQDSELEEIHFTEGGLHLLVSGVRNDSDSESAVGLLERVGGGVGNLQAALVHGLSRYTH